MPTKKEIARMKFRNWENYESVVKEAGTGSGTYEELRIFLESIGKQTYEEVQKKNMLLKELRSQTESIETSLEENKKVIAELEKEKENLARENAELRTQNNKLKNQNSRLEMDNQELIEKGVDDPIIKKIRRFDHEDRAELVERIDTYDDYITLQEKIQTLLDTKETVTGQIEKNDATISSQEEKISSLTEEIKKA